MDDTQTNLQLWNIVLSIASLLGTAMWAWLVYFVKRELIRLDSLEHGFNQQQINIVTNYVNKADHRDAVTRLEKRFDDGIDKIDRKLDTLFSKLDKKADKQ